MGSQAVRVTPPFANDTMASSEAELRASERVSELASERAALAAVVPSGCLLSSFQELIKIRVSRTPYKELTLTLHLLPTYPETPLLAEFVSSTLPDRLLAKFKDAVESEARGRAGSPQLVEAVQLVQRMVNTNMLIGCWDEIRQAKELLADDRCTLKLSEKTGKIGLTVTSAGHTVEMALRVPDAYPAEPVQVSDVTNDLNGHTYGHRPLTRTRIHILHLAQARQGT